ARTVDEIGRAATLFRDEFAGQRSLVEALEAGHVWAVWLGTPPNFPGDQAARRELRSRRLRGRRGGRRCGAGRRSSSSVSRAARATPSCPTATRYARV